MNKTIALLGNPNVGKTSLFNELTGTYQKVGNWTGVTVDIKKEKLKNNKSITIVDLPGLYSLSTSSNDEEIVLNYLKDEKPDVIVNIVDGMNLERNLDLTLSLKKLHIPVIVAVNFCDELNKNNIFLDTDKLSNLLKSPVIKISAKKKINLEELISLFLVFNSVGEPISSLSIKEILNKTYKKGKDKNKVLTEKIDNVFLNKFLGFPIFFVVIFLVYLISLKVGGFFGEYISNYFEKLSTKANEFFSYKTQKFVASFISLGVIKGVGSVLSFLPQVTLLFLLLSFLEESGYMSRVAFLLDRLFVKIGLNGKSVFPLILSMGCTVTGITATRVIENEREREKTIFLIPFMPCGAKTVVFAWASKTFFSGSPFIATFMYFLSLLVIIVVGRISIKGKENSYFLLEMPVYRLPKIKNLLYVMLIKVKEFLFKAGSVIFTVSVVYWFLIYFGLNGYNDGNFSSSFLFLIGNYLKYFFYPLGLKDYRISTSILSGLIARESIIETLIFYGNLSYIFPTKSSVFVFLTFITLSPPCVATLSCAKKELKSTKKLLKMIIKEIGVAYLVAFFINLIGNLKISPIYLILFLLFCIMCIGIKSSIKKKRRWRNENRI